MAERELSLNDLDQLPEEELEGFDPEVDFFTAPPPPDDGKYRVVLKQQEGKQLKAGTDKNGRSYYSVSIEARIVDPGNKFDNRPLFDNANTIVLRGSSRVAGVLQALRITPEKNAVRQVKQLIEALAGEPQVLIAGRWEASYKNGEGKYETFLKGQKTFPVNENGSYRHIVEAPDGSDVTAQFRILSYNAPKS